MYSKNKKPRAAPVGAIKASTSRENSLKSDIEAEARHETLTGINRAKWDDQLHAKAAEIMKRSGQTAIAAVEAAENMMRRYSSVNR